jgi:hypothetical protein
MTPGSLIPSASLGSLLPELCLSFRSSTLKDRSRCNTFGVVNERPPVAMEKSAIGGGRRTDATLEKYFSSDVVPAATSSSLGCHSQEEPMIERPFTQLAAADHGRLKIRHHLAFGHDWDAKGVGSVMMTFLGIALRGLLVTTGAVAIIAYLLLTNSHI